MAGAPHVAGLPPELQLGAGYIIRVTALDPATGAFVAGVQLTDVSLFVRNVGGGDGTALEAGPFLLVPGPGA